MVGAESQGQRAGAGRAHPAPDADPGRDPEDPRPRKGPGPGPAIIWTFHLTLPLAGLWLLIARPELDLIVEHHPVHFWLVLAVGALNVALGYRISQAARRREDARLFLVSLAFIASAGFLFLHALATPGVLLAGKNAGFVIATPVGLFLAGALAAGSSVHFTPERSKTLMRHQTALRAGLLVVMGAWALVSLLGLPPLRVPPDPQEAHGPLIILAVVSVTLYGIAALRYYRLHRRRPAVMLVSVVTAFSLLAEAMGAVAVARNWHLTWWTWHLLMAAGFGFVAYSAHGQYRREGSAAGLFNAIALEETIRDIRAGYAGALETLTGALGRQEEAGWSQEEMGLITAGLASRFGLTEGQVAVLDRAAEALAFERDQIRRLGALVAVGKETRVILAESELLERVVERVGPGLGSDVLRVGLLAGGELRFPPELATGTGWEPPDSEERRRAISRALTALVPVEAPAGSLIFPLEVKGHPSGVVEVHRARGSFGERDRSLLQSLASQISIAVENTRLYGQIEGLFRQYLSPDVATALLADPSQAALGGAVVEVSALFADLRGFTGFSERSRPEEIVTMLNRYFSAAVPSVLARGGTVVQFVGDAMLALFNAPARQADHALRAARAALEIQDAVEVLAAGNPGWPRFRVGVNTGLALVGNIGSDELRGFNAMGDAVNVASRLQSMAQPGQVVIGASTHAAIRGRAETQPLGDLPVRGRRGRVEAYILSGLREAGEEALAWGERHEHAG